VEPVLSVVKVRKEEVGSAGVGVGGGKAGGSGLSIQRVAAPPRGEKGDVLNRIVSKLSPNERVIGNTSVTIRPVTKVSYISVTLIFIKMSK
jgi:hypothetical protein